jgi:glycosyltransferase involved in cell wall biosynthesis
VISVLFATHNGEHTLPQMLRQLREVQAPSADWELIAVNDGSTDRTTSVLQDFLGHLPLRVINQLRGGKNRALNTAVAQARGGLIVFTDDDVLPESDWLVAFRQAAADHPTSDIFGGAILPHWEAPAPSWLLAQVPLGLTYGVTDPGLPEGKVYPGLVWGANMMVRRRVFESGLRFNESVGPAPGQYVMGSETDFNLRATAIGHRCCFVPRARVRHIIRAHQLEPDWILKRAFRFGRNVWDQERTECNRTKVPSLFGVPRWRLRSFVEHSVRAWLCHLRGRHQKGFMHDWEVKLLQGYFSQAWNNRTQ